MHEVRIWGGNKFVELAIRDPGISIDGGICRYCHTFSGSSYKKMVSGLKMVSSQCQEIDSPETIGMDKRDIIYVP